jgi:hypothetical protein
MSYLLTSPHKMLILKYKYMGFGNGNLQFTCWAPFCPSPQESQVFRLAAPLSNLGKSCYQNAIFQVPTGANPTSQCSVDLGIQCLELFAAMLSSLAVAVAKVYCIIIHYFLFCSVTFFSYTCYFVFCSICVLLVITYPWGPGPHTVPGSG